ncbi:MAG TPA: delta-60 repeat domain-containing protein [Verrucomicrobiae bacterium]|nr:delta-60 repeat domain-containing protein [Verrucomicrobiae bacterium]
MKSFALAFFLLSGLAFSVLGQDSLFDSSFQVGAGANGAVNAILVQTNGKILVGGEFTEIGGKTSAYLARLNSNGEPDSSFGSGTDGIVNRLLQLPDGKILVAGEFTHLQGVARHDLGRLMPDGSVDLSFDAGTNFESDEIVRTVCVQPDGKIVTASEKIVSYQVLSRFSRFEPDGQLDTSFLRTNTMFYSVFALLPLTNGMILAGGSFQHLGIPSYSGLARLREDGQVDETMIQPLATNSTVFSLTQLANGNILVGGSLKFAGSNVEKAVAELTPSLQWDVIFDADEVDFPSLSGAFVRANLVQPDGKIVIAGVFQEVGGYWRRHIARLDSEGHVDPCFDPGIGLGGLDGVRALAIQSDGRILVGGSFDNRDWIGVENIARLLPKGECNALRTYLIRSGEDWAAIGTCPPGGTNMLQMSTNLVDWETLDTETGPYLYSGVDRTSPKAFFRVEKVFQ